MEYMQIHTYTYIYMHISRYTCKYIHIHSNTYKSCTVCPRLCKEMPHPGQAMPLVCMYLYVFASIWSICVYEFADTCRYMQIHAYTYIYTQTRIHVAVRPHVTSPWLGPLTWDHFRSSLGPLTCDTRQSLHWGNWHGILLDCGLTGGPGCCGPTTFYFRNSCEKRHGVTSLGPLTCDTRQSLHWGNWHGILLDCALQAGRADNVLFSELVWNSKSSARCYGSNLTLLSKQNLPGFLLIPIFHRLFSTDQLSWFYLQSSSSCRILPRFRKLHHVLLQVLCQVLLTWSIKYFDIVDLNFKCCIIL
jgi:hypothetical protein